MISHVHTYPVRSVHLAVLFLPQGTAVALFIHIIGELLLPVKKSAFCGKFSIPLGRFSQRIAENS